MSGADTLAVVIRTGAARPVASQMEWSRSPFPSVRLAAARASTYSRVVAWWNRRASTVPVPPASAAPGKRTR